MAKRHIYLIRHGQYQLSKRENGELTERGHEQAATTGFAIRHIPFSQIWSSPVIRAHQTADIIAKYFPDVPRYPDDRLRECIPVVLDSYMPYFAHHYPDQTPDRMTQCAQALSAFFNELFVPPVTTPTSEDEYILVVCHGNVIRYFVSQTLETDSRLWTRMLINNCGISRVLVETDGQMFLVSHNDVGHLASDLLTEN